MQKQSFGAMIASLRKESGMTQLELAEKMGVTDKAVSKWERDLSFPDINSMPKLAEIFGLSVDELMQVKATTKPGEEKEDIGSLVNLILKAVALAMGVAVIVLSALKELDTSSAITLLGIGVTCLAVSSLQNKNENN